MSIDIGDIRAASGRIREYVHRTPMLSSDSISRRCGAQIVFKCENLQKVGAFKARGAMNAVLTGEPGRPVATHSSGNHGAALARAASLTGVEATVVVPANANAAKKAAIARYGARIVECEPTLAAREAALDAIVATTGALPISPYDDDAVIAGQGTCALEIVEDDPAIELILAPVGGGGLLAGCCLVGAAAGVGIVGAEPAGADDAFRSISTGVHITAQTPSTIADGLRTTLGVRNYAIISEHVLHIVVVEDQQIISAMRMLWEQLKLVVEPSAAVGLAAVLARPSLFSGKRVAIILTGGNVDLDNLPF